MSLLAYLIVLAISGLFVGALARLSLPGPDPMSIFQTILLGLGRELHCRAYRAGDLAARCPGGRPIGRLLEPDPLPDQALAGRKPHPARHASALSANRRGGYPDIRRARPTARLPDVHRHHGGRRRARRLPGRLSSQVSIKPPRFLACLSVKNRTYRIATRAEVLIVHFVPEDATELAEHFGGETGDEIDKFAEVGWRGRAGRRTDRRRA